jgi:thiol-disulfide isomerase/thioredoxin
MIERALLAAVFLTIGFITCCTFNRLHKRKAAANAVVDPLLNGLTPGIPTIVYFTTPTCIPCQTQQQPALSRLQEEMGSGVQIVRIDAAENYDAADRWGVFSAPTTFVLDSQKRVHHVNYGLADLPTLKRQVETARV